MKTLSTFEEFQIGKHQIGWMYNLDRLPETFTPVTKLPTFQKLLRNMTEAQIESELKPGLCTPGDVLFFLDNAPEECKDGNWNLFHFASFVVYVDWDSGRGGWNVYAWGRGGRGWDAGDRVFSPATGTQELGTGPSVPLTLENRVAALEAWKERVQSDVI
jgi:hypothetical protein